MRAGVAGLVVALLAGALPAAAAEWGGIRPGISTTAQVRALHGAPTKTSKEKVDNYDTETWVYDAPKAPAGLKRLTIEYGLVVAEKYQPDVVRAFRIEPQPGVFTRRIIYLGWGNPDRTGRDGDTDVFERERTGTVPSMIEAPTSRPSIAQKLNATRRPMIGTCSITSLRG